MSTTAGTAQKWICHVEGVNFANTLFDTRDLSTVRGSSLALLRIDALVMRALSTTGQFEPELIFNGASQCAVKFSADVEASALQHAISKELAKAATADSAIPFQHMSFVCGVAPVGKDQEKALKIARARALAAQHRGWTVVHPLFSADAKDADPLDMVRPGVVDGRLPGTENRKVSHSVLARRSYGKQQKQKFYAEELNRDGGTRDEKKVGDFCSDFGAMVANPPGGMPESLRTKIAVVYADGNKFGAARSKAGTQVFAQALVALRRDLLQASVDWLHAGSMQANTAFVFRDNVGDADKFRFETLLWGGDELMFVMPAWLALDFAEGFFRQTRDWKVGGMRLTHAVSIVVAHHKTPIRQLSKIAKEMADIAKDAGLNDENTLTFEAFESLSPPDVSIEPVRMALFGDIDEYNKEDVVLKLAMPGDRFGEVFTRLRSIKGDDKAAGFPRSQIHAALRAMRKVERYSILGAESFNKLQVCLAGYDIRLRSKDGASAALLSLPSNATLTQRHKLAERPEKAARFRGLDLVMISQMWDYLDPLRTALPRLATVGVKGGA